MQNVLSYTSYRAELEGVFRALLHIKLSGMEDTEIAHWCDNRAAVDQTNSELNSPKKMTKPEADIILAIHKVKKELKGLLPCRHVHAHQDTRRRMEATKKKTKPEVQLERKAEVDHREKTARTVGAT